MPLNFNPYQSTYVDPGSVAISETLRTRFADNLKADDEFSQSIADMISLAPDEGAKAALEDKYRAILDERADKGDYENMGTQILRDARKFTTEYQPILQNAQTRASIVENLKARRDKGDITSGMFDDAMAEMDADYAATGGVANEGSYNERQVAKFVNVNERIFDRIKKLDKDAVGGFEVNYLNLSPEEIAARGGAGQLGVGYDPEATYTYKTKDGITKYVPQEDIEAAFNSIMEEPDVREFMLQDARYSVNRMDDDTVLKVATDQAADFRQKAEATTDENMKRYYNESAGKIEEQLNNPEGVNMEAVRGIAMESTYVNNQSPLFRTALAIPGVEQTGGSRIVEYDQSWLSLSKDNAVVPFDTGVSGAIQQNYAASGLTLNEKNKYRENRENLLNEMKAPGYYDDTLGAGITFDTLSTMTEAEFVQMKGGATKEELALFNSAKNQQLEIMGELAAMDRLMAETMEATGQTEAARMASLREVKGGAELLDVVAKVFPNANQEEQWRLLKAYMTGNVGTGANQISTDALYQLADHPEGFGRTVTGFFGNKDLANREFAGRNVDDIMSDMYGAIEFSDQTINDYLNEVGTRQYTPTVYTSVPGMTVKQRSEVDRLFKGTNPHKRGTVFVSPKTGELVAFDQFLAEQEDAYDFLGQPKSEKFNDAMKSAKQVGAVMYNPANVGPGGGTIAVTYEVEIDGKTKQFEAQIPFTHIDSPAIKEYTSGTAYQFLRQASTQRNHGIERPLVTVLTAGGERVQVEVNFDNRTITPQSGQLEGRIMSLDAAMADDGFIANLNLSGDRIVAN